MDMRHCCPEDVTTMASTQQLLPSEMGIYVNKFSLCLPLVLFSQTEHRNVKWNRNWGTLIQIKEEWEESETSLKGK